MAGPQPDPVHQPQGGLYAVRTTVKTAACWMEDCDMRHEHRTNQTIRLLDGRTLGYAEYGAADGVPVFYFAGGNSSRLEGQWFEGAAIRKNIRLIVPDRPGF